MAYLQLQDDRNTSPVILLFTEGTILKPRHKFTLYVHQSYIPIGNCLQKIQQWHDQGAQIFYCASRRKQKQIHIIADILTQYGLPGSRLYYRQKKQAYQDIVAQIMPDVLIEDDCKSIGGKWQMCITHVPEKIKCRITAVTVKEFRGIDHLPDTLKDLMTVRP